MTVGIVSDQSTADEFCGNVFCVRYILFIYIENAHTPLLRHGAQVPHRVPNVGPIEVLQHTTLLATATKIYVTGMYIPVRVYTLSSYTCIYI